MATPITNMFSSFALTEEETMQGCLLTIAQKHFLHNELSATAHQKVALEIDPNNTLAFIQEEARLKGYLEAITYLLDCNDNAEEYYKQPSAPV